MKVQELPIKGYPFFIFAEDTANSDNRVCIIVDRPTNTAYWSPIPKNYSIKTRWTEYDFNELPEGALGNVHIPEINQARELTFKEFLKDIGY